MNGSDESQLARFTTPTALLEAEIIGQGEAPLWEYSYLFDDAQMADAIDLALTTHNNTKVIERGGQEAGRFVERLESVNQSISNYSASTGISLPPIQHAISRHDFCYQLALKERDIAAVLRETPGINNDYVEWLYNVADRVEVSGKL